MSVPTQSGAQPGVHCPHCGSEIAAGDSFCEACGMQLTEEPTTTPLAPDGDEAPIELSQPVRHTDLEPTQPLESQPGEPCAQCGGVVAADGYCETCGAKAASARDHFSETPASWVAGVCDRGIRHGRNEDALALAADPGPGGRAALVVCDGVSTSTDSDIASLAGAKAARDVLAAHRAAGLGTPESRRAAIGAALQSSGEAANDAVVANSEPGENTASATFVAAVVDGSLLVVGSIGDSRAYWIPDAGEPLLLTTDDSVAQVRIAAGVPREEAENGPQAHAITRWLGRDAPDVTVTLNALVLSAPGWVLVCSDGLWNYASEPAELQTLIADAGQSQPLALADALTAWANEQGGKDNISVALARFAPA